MKKHIIHLFWGASLLLAPTACQEHTVKDPLADAEACVDCHPDSALIWLQTLSVGELNEEQRARRALLLTQVSHKLKDPSLCHDSLINQAVAYFNADTHPIQRARSLFYQGIRRMGNNGNRREAVTSLLQAEKIFRKIDDPHYTGMTYERLGDLFYREHLYKQALEYYQKAYPYKLQASQPAYSLWIVRDMAVCFRLMEKEDSAQVYYEKVMERLHLLPEKEAACVQTDYAAFLYKKGEIEKAGKIIAAVPGHLQTATEDSLIHERMRIKELAETQWSPDCVSGKEEL